MKIVIRFIVLSIFTLATASPLSAQIKRGDRLFESGEYSKCIVAYERGLRHRSNSSAMERLASAYRITRNYAKAEEWYAKTVATNPNVSPMTYFWYSAVLKNNGKVEEARTQLKKFQSIQPESKRAEAELKSIESFRLLNEETRLYEVSTISEWNTSHSDFGVVYGNKGVFFVSDRGSIDILNGENSDATNGAYYSIYFSNEKKRTEDSTTYGSVEKLSGKINSDFHNGPVSLSGDYKLMAFNRIYREVHLRSKKFVNRGKIYFCTAIKNGWSKPIAFPWNSDKYSCVHPSLSADGKTLYFASDMSGSNGGMDIWISKFENNTWTQPVNLGSAVNSENNELFPYCRTDGALFFSSDGHGGLGGLDIFVSYFENNLWTVPSNQGAPLNSPADDFSIVFDRDNLKGYFSSNRSGGKGSDDIYKFILAGKIATIKGKLLTSKSGSTVQPNAKIQLIDENGNVVRSTTTDSQGKFAFANIAADKSYMARLDESDSLINMYSKYYLADENNVVSRVSVSHGIGGRYTFKNFPIDPKAAPQLVSDDENLTIAGNLIEEGSPPKALPNTKINLKDEQGNIVQTTTTNAFGAFAFSNIPPDRSYIVTVDSLEDVHIDINSNIIITDKNGHTVMKAKPDAKGRIAFELFKGDRSTLSVMNVEDGDLNMDMHGTITSADNNNTPIPNAKVSVIDENNIVLQTVKTDAKGNFRFSNIPSDRAYIVRVDGVEDPDIMAMGKIYVKDANGKVTKILNADGKKFEFRILQADRSTLGRVYVEDPWLEVLQMKAKSDSIRNIESMTIIENIYYNLNDYKVLPAAEVILAKVTTVMKADPNIIIEISSHTDSRSSNDYNLKLSQRRAREVVDYLVKRGIDKKRLVAIGYGETKLLNKCSNGVSCQEEEHAKNRRTEFKINRK